MNQAAGPPPLIGIAGWKKSGKTTLAERVIAELAARGLKVASIKHAHHNFRIDDDDTDSARHRRAGASPVAVVSARRWAVVRELAGEREPSLADVVAALGPCDLVIVEGYKTAPIPKIECRRLEAHGQEPLANDDPNVIAVAADHATDASGRPVFALDDIAGIADLIVKSLGLPAART